MGVRAWPPGSWSRAAAIHCSSPRSRWPFQHLWENCKKVFHPPRWRVRAGFQRPWLPRPRALVQGTTHTLYVASTLPTLPAARTMHTVKNYPEALPRGLESEEVAALALQTPPTPALGASFAGEAGRCLYLPGSQPPVTYPDSPTHSHKAHSLMCPATTSFPV